MQGMPSLREVPFFRHLNDDERGELEELLEPAAFEVGETIFEEGGPEDKLYVITLGTVVCEMGVLTEPRATASVEARTPVEAYGIDRDCFLEMLDADAPAACKVVYEIGRTLAGRMARTDESIAGIIAHLERAGADYFTDFEIFQDRLIREWSF